MSKKEYSFKFYAKEARERLKTGFWEKQNQHWDNMTREAELQGKNVDADVRYEQRELEKKLYNRDAYDADEKFYAKVYEMMEGEEIVTNPIQVLCDMENINELPINQRTQRTLEISNKYQEMMKRYYKEKNILK